MRLTESDIELMAIEQLQGMAVDLLAALSTRIEELYAIK